MRPHFSDGRCGYTSFFYRLRVTLENPFDLHYEAYVPAAESAQVRSRIAKFQQVDIYGYRPLTGVSFALLPPFLFFMYFCSEPLHHPGAYLSNPRT